MHWHSDKRELEEFKTELLWPLIPCFKHSGLPIFAVLDYPSYLKIKQNQKKTYFFLCDLASVALSNPNQLYQVHLHIM